MANWLLCEVVPYCAGLNGTKVSIAFIQNSRLSAVEGI